MSDALVPQDLLPRWRELPALAWLAAGRFSGRAAGVPVLGLLVRAVGWPTIALVLIGARADRAVAAWQRRAMVVVTPKVPGGIRWRRLLASMTALPFAVVAFAAVPLLCLVAAAIAAMAGAPRIAAACTVMAAITAVWIAVQSAAFVVQGLRTFAPGERHRAYRWARHHHLRLVEATTLAAAQTNRRAATVLVRRLLRHADSSGTVVLASPRTEELATLYARFGFRPVTGGTGRTLLREARPSTSQPATCR